MFEKEAEEYATRECCTTCNNINHFCKEKCECWTFAKKGAEFGYNKANKWHKQDTIDIQEAYLAGLKEGKPKWHDLRESPKDLRKQIKLVIMYIVGNVYCNGWFNGDWWIVDNGNMIKIHREVVIAWCEIPKYTKENE